MNAELRLGTRGSQLALWQANAVGARLQEASGRSCRIIVIKTTGDRLHEAPLSEVGGKRLFVKEIEDALLRDDIDLAVHSSKDMPALLPDGLMIGAVLPREDPLDAIVLPHEVRLKPDTTYEEAVDSPGGVPGFSRTVAPTGVVSGFGGSADPTGLASSFSRTVDSPSVVSGFGETADPTSVASGFSRTVDPTGVVSGSSRTADAVLMSFNDVVATLGESPAIGTSSVRRIAQLTRLFPRARFLPIRGNLDTRLRKLDSGEYDAIVLAAAGLRRLGLASRISARVPSSVCIPAPGQGIVAIEIRDKDPRVGPIVHLIDDREAHAALNAERAVVEALGGGCQTPIGALASSLSPDEMELVAVVISLDGRRAIAATGHGKPSDAAAIGASVGAQLLADGAGDILAEADRSRGAVEGIQP
jgi:hydroxymethylbilane synthase